MHQMTGWIFYNTLFLQSFSTIKAIDEKSHFRQVNQEDGWTDKAHRGEIAMFYV